MLTRQNNDFLDVLVSCLWVVVCLLGLAREAGAERVTIVSPQGPLPSVVAADNWKDLNKAAAADLCDYLSRLSGREIKVSPAPADEGVVIHVGRDAFVKQN